MHLRPFFQRATFGFLWHTMHCCCKFWLLSVLIVVLHAYLVSMIRIKTIIMLKKITMGKHKSLALRRSRCMNLCPHSFIWAALLRRICVCRWRTWCCSSSSSICHKRRTQAQNHIMTSEKRKYTYIAFCYLTLKLSRWYQMSDCVKDDTYLVYSSSVLHLIFHPFTPV